MKIVNDGLPEILYNFLKQDFYDFVPNENAISATTTLKPIREIILTQRHSIEIEIKASRRVHSLMGSAMHAVLEKIDLPGSKKEERLSTCVDGMTIAGKFDLIHNNTIYDFKTTKAWSKTFGMDEWKKQLSIYRFLYFKTTGVTLSNVGRIIPYYKDWDAKNILKKKNYPLAPMEEIPVPLLPCEIVEKFLRQKVRKIKSSRKLGDAFLPECTNEERWWNDKKKVFNKCEIWCPAYKFCSQTKEERINAKKGE